MSSDWEDRKPKKNGETVYVSLPKKWWEQDAGKVLNMHFIFTWEDGKPKVELRE